MVRSAPSRRKFTDSGAAERATLDSIGRTRTHAAFGLVGLVVVAACGGDEIAVGTVAPATTASDDSTPITAAPTVAPTGGTGADTQPTAPPPTEPPVVTDAPTTTAPPLQPVTTQIVGTAVGGTAGSFGPDSTDPFSEAVRTEDGTCSGWDPPQRGRWTGGLESGAPVVILERDGDRQIGSGQIGTSAWVDVDPSGTEQWNCEFPFTGEVEGNPESFRIKVADLDPWVARADPTTPGAFVVSVNTVARWEDVPSCTEEKSPESVADWEAVGVFWSRGVDSLCSADLAVVDIERTCRPPDFASESIISVVSAADPSVVIDDAGGRRVDPNDLEPLTEVAVVVATGRPC